MPIYLWVLLAVFVVLVIFLIKSLVAKARALKKRDDLINEYIEYQRKMTEWEVKFLKKSPIKDAEKE